MRAFLLLASIAAAAAAQPAPPSHWLVIERVDVRGRQPFNPDAIFHHYLLDRNAAAPREGDKIKGKAWRKVAPNDKGRVSGRIAYAYAAIESDTDQVVLARAPGGGRLYVNGDAFVLDIYRAGHSGVPVELRKGTNHMYVRGVRGGFRFEFIAASEGIMTAEKDVTKPHGKGLAGVVKLNVSRKSVAGFVPLGVRKLGIEMEGPRRKAGEAYRRTFRSAIDNSVQEYAVLAPTGKATGIVLTLHGAGVGCLGQARSYSAKSDLWIVAPTNRRPFGFDWQDWGRRDAYEVLEDAIKFTGVGRDRIYLTGHSMGGHGTWHLAANDPDTFAAIAPSAAWCSFDTYVGRPQGKRAALWQGADGASLTPNLLSNLAQIPTFILHGLKDDNVPPREARLMETLLFAEGGSPIAHYQPGAGHWWNGKQAKGADCVDWPGIFDLFGKHRRRRPGSEIDFVSVDPGVDADHFGIRLQQPLRYGMTTRIKVRRGDKATLIKTRNVRRFRCGGGGFTVDGQQVKTTGDGPHWFLRESGKWTIEAPNAHEKSPERSGPFKRAFDNHFVFVYGGEEDMARARFDAQMWWYRGNGDVEVVSAYEFLEKGFKGRNVIIYGNATSNRAWKAVFDKRCPIEAEEGVLAVGDSIRYGRDWACVFVYPRKGEPTALAAAFAHTGPRGARLGYSLLPFVSGVGYPDYAVFSPAVLLEGDGGVAEAGWFAHDWSLPR